MSGNTSTDLPTSSDNGSGDNRQKSEGSSTLVTGEADEQHTKGDCDSSDGIRSTSPVSKNVEEATEAKADDEINENGETEKSDGTPPCDGDRKEQNSLWAVIRLFWFAFSKTAGNYENGRKSVQNVTQPKKNKAEEENGNRDLCCYKRRINVGGMTLEEALNRFKLMEHLKNIEINLEKVRKRQRTKEQHESDLKQFDKEIRKLSFEYHPDRVRNRGCSDTEMAAAQELQTALNTTRTVLNVLGEVFLEDIDTDHSYEFYTNLSITSLGNEKDIKSRIDEVVFEISYLSEIKKRYIIAEIRHFLQEGQGCIKSFIEDNGDEFEKCRILAMQHLKKCIEGFKKLLKEFGSVIKDCKSEKKNHVALHLDKLSTKSFHSLTALEKINNFFKNIPDGGCRIYQPPEVDDYLVLPFVCYMNGIVTCSAVLKNRKQQNSCILSRILSMMRLSSNYSQRDSLRSLLKYLRGQTSPDSGCKLPENTDGDRTKILEQVKGYLEDKFQIEHYSVRNTDENDIAMYAELKTEEQEIRRGIERIETMTEELKKKLAEAMKESEEQSTMLKERLESSRLLREQTAASLGR